MRCTSAILAISVLAACVPVKRPQTSYSVSSDWAAVQSLPHGARVFLQIDSGDVRRGLLDAVTSDELRRRERNVVTVVPMANIVGVARLTSHRSSHALNALLCALGLVGDVALAQLIAEGEVSGSRAFVTVAALGATYGAATRPFRRETTTFVYRRR